MAEPRQVPQPREGDDVVVTTEQQLYHHIQIFGRPGHFTVRPDNDASAEQPFVRYDAAIAWTIRFLCQSILDLDE